MSALKRSNPQELGGGALLGAVYGRDAVPHQWVEALLNCRPAVGKPHVYRPRPECFWPVDALELAEKLIMEDSPWILSHARGEVCISQPWVHGLKGKVIGHTGRWDYINFGNHEIWIDAGRQKERK